MKARKTKRGVVHETWHLPDLRAPVDMRATCEPHRVGTYLTTEESAALRLASAIHFAESTCVAVSWSAQERAQDYINAHGLADALTEATRLEALGSGKGRPA